MPSYKNNKCSFSFSLFFSSLDFFFIFHKKSTKATEET